MPSFVPRERKRRGIYDKRFCRTLRFYLVMSELALGSGGHVVLKIQFAKHQDAVPLTRDYLFAPGP